MEIWNLEETLIVLAFSHHPLCFYGEININEIFYILSYLSQILDNNLNI